MANLLPKGEDQVVLKEKAKTKKPSLYRVLLHNDDYTTMEYVVHVLMQYFQKTQTQATEIMIKVHKSGIGIAGVYTYEIAETKVLQVSEDARRHEFPLKCTMEKSD